MTDTVQRRKARAALAARWRRDDTAAAQFEPLQQRDVSSETAAFLATLTVLLQPSNSSSSSTVCSSSASTTTSSSCSVSRAVHSSKSAASVNSETCSKTGSKAGSKTGSKTGSVKRVTRQNSAEQEDSRAMRAALKRALAREGVQTLSRSATALSSLLQPLQPLALQDGGESPTVDTASSIIAGKHTFSSDCTYKRLACVSSAGSSSYSCSNTSCV
jgi:hypothetical protein